MFRSYIGPFGGHIGFQGWMEAAWLSFARAQAPPCIYHHSHQPPDSRVALAVRQLRLGCGGDVTKINRPYKKEGASFSWAGLSSLVGLLYYDTAAAPRRAAQTFPFASGKEGPYPLWPPLWLRGLRGCSSRSPCAKLQRSPKRHPSGEVNRVHKTVLAFSAVPRNPRCSRAPPPPPPRSW